MFFDALDGAAGQETTSRLNVVALDNIRLQSRILVDVENRELGKVFLGHHCDLPFGVAPMGMCNLFWPGADNALAKTVRERNLPLGVSTMASSSIEHMINVAGNHAWFQLYVGDSVEMTESLIERAKNAGYKTLILTADVPVLAPRIRDLRNGFTVPFKMGLRQFVDIACHPTWALHTLRHGRPKPINVSPMLDKRAFSSGKTDIRGETGRGRIDWEFLSNLRKSWPNNLIVKGVMSPADARMAINRGADAVYVSNHGGRQMDSAPAAIQMLPLIRQEVGPDYPLLFDSGIRNGENIVKALALGADLVMLGRPFLYALGALGEKGLNQLIDLLAAEVSVTLAQLGCPNISNLDRNAIADSY
jgi:L-lactate dehydrogenase (cytochrome)